jgi:lambda repressor-like predicted transcriptional regulator
LAARPPTTTAFPQPTQGALVIDSISTSLAYGSNPYGPSGSQASLPGMDAAAKALGLTDAQLQQSLQSGSTLSDLATQQGVSEDSLVSTIAQSLQENAPAGSSSSSTDYTSLAQNIVQGKTPHHHHGHHARAASPSQDAGDTSDDDPFGTAAGVLGMSQDDLLDALESGSSFTDLLSAKGLTVDDLTNALGTSQGTIVDTTA